MYIAAIDQGTTSTRCYITTTDGEVAGTAQFEHEQIMPREGWVEHDPREIWRNTRRALSEALVDADLELEDISAVGLTNQRETAVVWDKATGRPVYNAIVWQDTRTERVGEGEKDRYLRKTGLLANSYPAGPKWAWILDNVEGARERAEKGELLAGTVDTWLIWNLTGGARGKRSVFGRGGAQHVTDVTNASRTLLMDLETLDWDDSLCEEIGVPRKILPEIRPSFGSFGTMRRRKGSRDVPITGVLGDQQAALFGQGCLEQGDAKMTYGTGLFMLLNTGEEPQFSDHGLLTTVAYQQDGKKPVYALEGSVAVGGSLIQWLRDQMGILSSAAESETLASQVDDSAGVVIVPAFSGLFAPRWRPDARGVITGITRYIDRRHIARAALDATCLQTLEVVNAMEKDSGISIDALRVDGGMTANDLLMQMQADMLNSTVVRPDNMETTVMGAASAAGFGAGLIDDPLSLGGDTTWENEMAGPDRDRLVSQWEEAVSRSLDLAP
ncbi:glycerol kinase GlpK [Corynebacterium genitalium ATCC 33030]|mgnify:CR=1 FL=1|uniref:glycerol kinase n=1 Tax=Corynebacterium genitalium ATCC 33030 TaxID=585529 RepID=D7W9F6_9CORY|nr:MULTISPECIES: glycerol kinase GlpK [Corynebacterium]EFK55436.1 glycerol kinase [Corynebacterium genitalium ATCC 33030]MCQ4623350.1 glycerol kinase GlpK [Corynebacterium sp. CCUG 70398]UUA89320.1 glycerol kinase GlpK [Corynebacterium genitalium ATCC 33030]